MLQVDRGCDGLATGVSVDSAREGGGSDGSIAFQCCSQGLSAAEQHLCGLHSSHHTRAMGRASGSQAGLAN